MKSIVILNVKDECRPDKNLIVNQIIQSIKQLVFRRNTHNSQL